MSNRKLFLCSSRFSLLSAINLKKTLFKEARCDLVLYVKNESIVNEPAFEEVIELFEDIQFFNPVQGQSLIVKLTRVILSSPVFSRLTVGTSGNCHVQKYDEVISQNLIFIILMRGCVSFKKASLLDEGMSSYTGRVLNVKYRHWLYKVISFLTFRGQFNIDITTMYLHEPKLYSGPEVELVTIPKPQNIKNNLTSSTKIYSIIFLGSDPQTMGSLLVDPRQNTDNFKDSILQYTSLVRKRVYEKGGIYRPHPNEDTLWAMESRRSAANFLELSWELGVAPYLNSHDILISYFSSACFVPKVLFGREPTLIFLYKLFDEEFLGAEVFIEKFRTLYTLDNKVIVPESLNQLMELFDNDFALLGSS
jgi:hypothetical protein